MLPVPLVSELAATNDAALAPHGGNRLAVARRLGCRPEQLLEASASLVPFGPPASVRRSLRRALAGLPVPRRQLLAGALLGIGAAWTWSALVG